MRLLSDQRDKLDSALKLIVEAEQLVVGSGLPADNLRIELGRGLSAAKAILQNFLDRR